MKRAAVPPDPGLQEIHAWHDWFVAGHEERFRDVPDTDTHLIAQERAKIAALAAGIRERMTSDYLARTRSKP